MLRNLLSNAVRYTDRGTILLGCRRAGDKIRIEVWDSGIGISQDQLPHIFQEYYQGAHGAERGGFGLGLAIVRRMGKMLDHRIDVRSTLAGAPCFRLRFRAETQAAIRLERAQTPRFEREDFPTSFLSLKTRRASGSSLASPAENERHRGDRGRNGG